MADSEPNQEQAFNFGCMQPRFYDTLSKCDKILIAGCGGGFDIFQGIPLFSHLKSLGKELHLANLTFCGSQMLPNNLLVDANNQSLYRIPANCGLEKMQYCPEAYLAQFLHEKCGLDQPVYLILREGYKRVIEAYKTLLKAIGPVDAIVLIDGGTDSLMKGDEEGLGTVQEDYTSMLAVHDLPGVKVKLLAALGMGVDRYHGVSDVSSLRAISEIHQMGGFLGAQMLFSGTQPVDLFVEAVQYATDKTSTPSIVGTSIRDAMIGHFGNHHSNKRTKGSKLFINPLMTLLVVFDLATTVSRIDETFRDEYRKCETGIQVFRATEMVRENMENIREVEDFPLTDDC